MPPWEKANAACSLSLNTTVASHGRVLLPDNIFYLCFQLQRYLHWGTSIHPSPAHPCSTCLPPPALCHSGKPCRALRISGSHESHQRTWNLCLTLQIPAFSIDAFPFTSFLACFPFSCFPLRTTAAAGWQQDAACGSTCIMQHFSAAPLPPHYCK